MKLSNRRPNRALLKAEMLLCLGPSFLYLLTGIVVVPHQFWLLISGGVLESLWALLYYVGIAAMFVSVRSMYHYVTGDPIGIIQARSAWLCLIAGLAALAMGPAGTFLLAGSEVMIPMLTIPLVALPAFCLLHLAFLSREYLSGAFLQKM